MTDLYQAPEAELHTNIQAANNSGQGPVNTYPESIKGWSWGAFLLSWIWAIGNKTWIGLAALIPYIGFIVAIILGIKGRQWAWEKNHWQSVEHFNRTQKRWTYWAVAIYLSMIVIVILTIVLATAFEQ